jgi:hypothetical protein
MFVKVTVAVNYPPVVKNQHICKHDISRSMNDKNLKELLFNSMPHTLGDKLELW